MPFIHTHITFKLKVMLSDKGIGADRAMNILSSGTIGAFQFWHLSLGGGLY